MTTIFSPPTTSGSASIPKPRRWGRRSIRALFDKGYDGCWIGCTLACAHGVKDFVPTTGPYKGQKVFVDGPEYETIAGCGSNLGIFDPVYSSWR